MALKTKPFDTSKQTPPDLRGDNFKVPTGRGVLSAAEIEALLRPDIPADAFEPPKDVTPHGLEDLGQGGASAKEQDLYDDAAALAARMTLSLRRACQVGAIVTLKSASRAPLSHLISQYQGEPVLILFQDHNHVPVAGLTLERRLAITVIDRACGGAGKASRPDERPRPFSELDKSILEDVLRPLAHALDPAFSIACVEANRSAAHALLPPGKAMLADLNCQIDGLAGRAAFARLAPAPVTALKHGAPVGINRDTSTSAGALVTSLTARIASLSVPVSRLADLKAGSVLLLGLPTDQPVELLSGGHQGQPVAEGDVGRKGNRIAIRITKRKPTL